MASIFSQIELGSKIKSVVTRPRYHITENNIYEVIEKHPSSFVINDDNGSPFNIAYTSTADEEWFVLYQEEQIDFLELLKGY